MTHRHRSSLASMEAKPPAASTSHSRPPTKHTPTDRWFRSKRPQPVIIAKLEPRRASPTSVHEPSLCPQRMYTPSRDPDYGRGGGSPRVIVAETHASNESLKAQPQHLASYREYLSSVACSRSSQLTCKKTKGTVRGIV
jgi:hypothetical protein